MFDIWLIYISPTFQSPIDDNWLILHYAVALLINLLYRQFLSLFYQSFS